MHAHFLHQQLQTAYRMVLKERQITGELSPVHTPYDISQEETQLMPITPSAVPITRPQRYVTEPMFPVRRIHLQPMRRQTVYTIRDTSLRMLIAGAVEDHYRQTGALPDCIEMAKLNYHMLSFLSMEDGYYAHHKLIPFAVDEALAEDTITCTSIARS